MGVVLIYGCPSPPAAPKATFNYIGRVLRLNAPFWYRRKDFLDWLNSGKAIATWHKKGEVPGEFSDVFFTFDHEEGSDRDDLPEDIWQEVCAIAKEQGFTDGVVWVSNLQE